MVFVGGSSTSGKRLTLCLSLLKARGTPNSSQRHFSPWKYNGEHRLLINLQNVKHKIAEGESIWANDS